MNQRLLAVRFHSVTVAGMLAISIAACSESTSAGPPVTSRPRVQPAWVTGEAAAALDSSTGFFRLAYPPPTWVSLTLTDSIAVCGGAIARRAESIH